MRDTKWIKDTLFAHRGLHNNKQNIPENSLLAFKRAFDKGYGIELDLHLIKDKSLIVFHDSSLMRLAKVDLKVEDNNYEDLKKIKLLQSGENIPLLSDLLEILPKGTPMLVEFKANKYYKEMIESFIQMMESREVIFAIQSFDPRVLHYFKKKAPNMLRGQIAESTKSKRTIANFFMNVFLYNVFTKPDFINYHFEDLPNKRIDKLKKKGITIISYTVKSQKSFDFIKSRYDNCVFEGFEPKH